ncbi:universal stress protein [Pseudonocardia petroleophila]|uniref:Universal stress protein n=1 Tax=Pseudonocardia petroleophila TaxID=37331 RepID=A0A7G7MF51_9PSEU|nr:universal stress protein [Pseudonocardia petroleophila]QNG51412.1 universal stress protein [Pseudonocardia petroleophila]
MHERPGGRTDVVVGVDDSDHALHAVGWAAAEARLRGASLRIVHAGTAGPGPRGVLARAVTVARRAEPGLAVSTTLSPAEPVLALLDAASAAALLVVGMGGSVDRVLVSSVALDVSTRAACPVVVVRGGPVPPHGPVLVGVDTVEGDAPALTVAFCDARRHGGRVAVLHSRAVATAPVLPAAELAADIEARNRLCGELSPWTARFPDVPVEVSVVHDLPATALLRAAEGARLLAVGTRGHGAYARALFGSTSREVLRRSPVTVVVVDPVAAVHVAQDAQTSQAATAGLDHPHDRSVLF